MRLCLCVCVNEFSPSPYSLGFQSHLKIENSVAKLSARENHLSQKYSLLWANSPFYFHNFPARVLSSWMAFCLRKGYISISTGHLWPSVLQGWPCPWPSCLCLLFSAYPLESQIIHSPGDSEEPVSPYLQSTRALHPLSLFLMPLMFSDPLHHLSFWFLQEWEDDLTLSLCSSTSKRPCLVSHWKE